MSLPPDLLWFTEKEIGEIHSVERLRGGRTNDVWRLIGSGFDLVLKRYDVKSSNFMFPNNPVDEAKILGYLHPLGRSPKLMGKWSTDGSSFLAYEFQKGVSASQTTKEAIQELSKIHELSPPNSLRRISMRQDALRQKAIGFIENLSEDWRAELRDTEPTKSYQFEESPCLLHGDPIPQNAISHSASVTFVDWQCPAIGDPVYDLALAVSPAMHIAYGAEPLTESEELSLVHAYENPRTVEKFLQIRPMLSWLISAYCAQRASQGFGLYDRAAREELTRSKSR